MPERQVYIICKDQKLEPEDQWETQVAADKFVKQDLIRYLLKTDS